MTEKSVMLWGGIGEDPGGWGTPDLHENVPPSLFAAIFMRYSDARFAKCFRTRKFTTLVSWRGIDIRPRLKFPRRRAIPKREVCQLIADTALPNEERSHATK
jgi:hypothetical protein